MQRVVLAWRDVVRSEQDEKKQQRHGPGVLEGHALPSLEETLCFAPFRSLLYIGFGVSLPLRESDLSYSFGSTTYTSRRSHLVLSRRQRADACVSPRVAAQI